MNPLLLEVNTRARLAEISRQLGRRATLDDVPDPSLDEWAASGFDWIWLLGVWQTGAAGRRISASNEEWRAEYRRLLPDFEEADIVGSCFAIVRYAADTAVGGDEALARFRERLGRRGMRLMLDFVPNHTALDHPWAASSPEFYVRDAGGWLAHGRDPYFPPWPDTLQLNYASPGLQQAMRQELVRIAGRCDGVRCDMAMLILPAVFERTWGLRAPPFWPDAIARLRQRHPGFVFLAEAYWDLEWTLQQQGFDYTYDKTLYDRLRQGGAAGVRGHLSATLEYQGRSARFLENHDEPRAASVFPAEQHRAAAAIAYLAPGLRFVHDGQTEGRRVRASVHLRRRAEEPADGELRSFYGDLLRAAAAISGRSDWRLLECARAWPDNWTAENFVCLAWGGNSPEWLAVVNYAGCQGQCFVQFPFPALDGRGFRLSDRLSAAVYDRSGDELRARGLYLDLPPWGCHVFDVKPLPG